MAKRGPYWTDSGSDWRVAHALETLADEFDQWLPEGATWNGHAVHGPSRRYVGTLGNAAHRAEGWENSDHNPFIRLGNTGIVRAMDVDFGYQPLNDYVRDRLSKMYWQHDPRIYDSGYAKSNGRITANGSHGGGLSNLTRSTSPGDYGHVHISVTRNGDSYNSQCDSRAPWGFVPAPKPTPPTIMEEVMSYYKDRADFEASITALVREQIREFNYLPGDDYEHRPTHTIYTVAQKALESELPHISAAVAAAVAKAVK